MARFPGALPLGPLWLFGLTFLPVLLLGTTYDLITRRRVHAAYIWGGALLILSVPVRLAISTTQSGIARQRRSPGTGSARGPCSLS
ncbi:MAG TPA: hypothetical protein VK466_00920 [Terriglobales bacterium]|nr:hypothetical protein [Terriglobales bacterium]